MSVETMKDRFLNIKEVCEILGRSSTYCYKVIRDLNAELEEQGYCTVTGSIPKSYLEKRLGLNIDWE